MSWNIRGGLKDIIRRGLIIERIGSIKDGIALIQEPGKLSREEFKEMTWEMKRIFKEHKIIYSNNENEYGGILTILIGEWVNRYVSWENDPMSMARFHKVSIRGKNNCIVDFINIYRPHFSSTGIRSVAEQQRRQFEQKGKYEKTAEEYWREDLSNMIKDNRTNDTETIIAGDFNKQSRENIKEWETMNELGLINVLEDNLGIRNRPTRKPGDGSAIDHIYASKNLRPIKGQILEFDNLSDHAPLYIEFSGLDIFKNITPRQKPSFRKVHSGNPYAVAAFRTKLEREIHNHHIIQELENIESEWDRINATNDRKMGELEITEIEDRFSNIVEKLDRLTKNAENKAAKDIKGREIISAEERDIRRRIIAWRQVLTWKKYGKKSRLSKTKIKKILRSIHQKEIMTKEIDIEHIRNNLKEEWEKWRTIRDTKWRRNNEWRFYNEAKGKIMLGDKREVEAIVHTLKNMNTSKDQHNRIKRARNKISSGGIHMLMTEINGEKREITEKEKIEEIAIKECERKIHAADNTPLYKKQIKEILKIDGSIEEWEEMYNSQIISEDNLRQMQISRGTRLFLEELQMIRHQSVPIEMSKEEYHRGWKKQRERTSSHGAIHFSHMMCTTEDSMANAARALVSKIRLQKGLTPRNYMRATDILLLKKANDFRPEKMRLITLQHAAGNHDFKLVGKHINYLGEKNKMFEEEQYGSRTNCAANTQALNKKLLIDISKLQRRTMIIVANDAKGCYDRVIPWIMFFTMRRLGITYETARTTVKTITEMTHNVSTAYGISKSTYGGKGSNPNGLKQGNGFAAQFWAALSSILIKIIKREGYGIELKSAIQGIEMRIPGLAFVDDTDLIEMERDDEGHENTIQRMQQSLDLWNELLETTGGALEPLKTDWSIVTYNNRLDTWIPSTCQAKITLQDEITKERIELQKLMPHEARRTLGIWQALDGNNKKQVEVMIEAINEYGKQMITSGLSRREKLLALKTTINRTIAYAAPATTLSREETKQVNKALRKATISGLGLARTTPLAIIHGPKSRNGYDIPDFNTTQLYEHVKSIIDNIDTDTLTGKLMKQMTEGHQLEVGSEMSIWELYDNRLINSMTETWIRQTIKEMKRHKMKIRTTTQTLMKWRKGDQFIMDLMVRAPGYNFKADQIERIQEVRKHLRVNTLTDILIEGKVDNDTWIGRRAIGSISKERYKWPKSHEPSQQAIEAWKDGLRAIGITGPNQTITNVLGSWYEDILEKKEGWISKDNTIIRVNDNKNEIRYYKRNNYKRNERSEYLLMPQQDTRIQEVEQWLRARIITNEENNVWFLEHIQSTTRREIRKKNMSTTWTEQYITANEHSINDFQHKIQTGEASLVVDASDNKEGVLTCAFVEEIQEEYNRKPIEGRAQIPSKITDANSYRGELGGILQTVRFVKEIEQKRGITKGKCTIKCDNISAIRTAQKLKQRTFISCREASFDIVKMLHTELNTSNLGFQFQWVKGHQDRNNDEANLSNEAKANCRADEIAGEFSKILTPIECPPIDELEGPSLLIAGMKIHSNIEEAIRTYIHGKILNTYWKDKGRYAGEENEIEWEALKNANKTLSWEDQLILTKLLSGWAATSETMYRREFHLNPACPLCNQEIETTKHQLRCSHQEMKDAFRQKMEEMSYRLRKRIKDQRYKTILIHLINQYHNTGEYGTVLNTANEQIYEAQNRIGEFSILEGIFHRIWTENGLERNDIQLMTTEVFRLRISMWKKRNEIFKRTEEDIKMAEKLLLQYDEAIKGTPENMSNIDFRRYIKTQIDFEKMALTDKQRWLKTTEGIRKKYSRLRKRGLDKYGFKDNRSTARWTNTRKRNRERTIRELQNWIMRNKKQCNEDMRIRAQNIEHESEMEQGEWILSMQKLRRQNYEKEQQTLKEWVTSRDQPVTDRIAKERQTSNDQRRNEEPPRKARKITEWLTRKSNDT